MSIALFAVPGVLAPLQGLWRWFTTHTTHSRTATSGAQRRVNESAAYLMASSSHHSRVKRQTPARVAACRPLRVIRILEVGQTPAQVGRMVISGRMADVCAELDRLAAREAALH